DYTTNSNLTGTQPFVLGIYHYQDNRDIVVVRISRVNYYNYFTVNYCFEQRLLLRVIQANGSVTEIKFDNAKEIQDINYCFLRLSGVSGTNNHFEWKQYGYKGNGIFYLLQKDTLELPFNYQITTFGTLNSGYAIVYANTTNSTSSNNTLAAQFTADAGLYAIMLNYNQTKTNKTTILHEMSTPNVKIRFSAMICSIDNVFVGHTCVAAGIAVQNGSTTTSTLTNTTTKPFYIKVHFHSTGSVFKLESIFDIPSSGGIETIRAMTFGGFALISRSYNYNGRVIDLNFSLYDDNNNRVSPRRPITSNFVSAFEIIQNNTLLIALNETFTTWNLFSMDLPRLSPYDVNSTNPSRGSNNLALNSNKISITFQNPVLFADGILYIYQKTNKGDVLRQSIRSKACDDRKCNILDNVVTLINRGKLRLTTTGSLHFQGLSDSEKHEFFTNLRSELVFIIPTEEGRLSSNERNQIDTSSTESKILISLSINGAKSGEITATVVKNYLNLLIINKESTNVSTGSITMYLDETYGFQETTFVFTDAKAIQVLYIP
ncbi:7793_t:CDS:2, partial [Gigaspora margarita]